MKKTTYCCIYILITCCFYNNSAAQVNILGKPGYMTIPSASWEEDRPLGFSFAYVPREYTGSMFFGKAATEGNTLNFYNARIGLTSFMDVNLTIAYRPLMADRIGVGDRQLDFRFKLLAETKYRPSLVLGVTPPGSVSPVLSHDYLVATKNFQTSIGVFQVTAGYGSPYVFIKNNREDLNFWESLEIGNKADVKGNNYLTGFFGGFAYSPVHYFGVMMEYNSATFNTGAYVKPWPWLQLQGYTFEGKKMAFTVGGNFSLDFAPYTLRRHEKTLD